jgi:hypothetical protein
MNKYYFFDRGILQGQALNRVDIHPACGVKESLNPLFTEERESKNPKLWEVRYDNSYPNVIWDDEEKIFKLFYTLIIEDAECENTPISERKGKEYIPRDDRRCALAYAQSYDGLNWEKPNLGIVSFKGSKENNLLLVDTHGGGVFLDKNEQVRSKRYKMVALKDIPGEKSMMSVSFSDDGIHWDELKPWVGESPWGDTHNLPFFDEESGRYKVITREWEYGLRVATVFESEDFYKWERIGVALKGIGFNDQVYSMPVFKYNGLYLGLASIFHEGDKSDENFDCVDCELTYSKNTKDFNFVSYGEPLIKRGSGSYHDGEFDCCCIYAAPPLIEDGKINIYYMGGNGRHTSFRETSFARISFEEDKIAYISPKSAEDIGEVVTANFVITGDTIEILADTYDAGSIDCAIFDKWNGKAIDCFSFSNCILEKLEDGWLRLEFSNSIEELVGRKVCIKINLYKTKMYAMRGDIKLANLKY